MSVNLPENLQMCDICKLQILEKKKNKPQDMFSACDSTREISRPSLTNSFALAVSEWCESLHSQFSFGMCRLQTSSSTFRFAHWSSAWSLASEGMCSGESRAKTLFWLRKRILKCIYTFFHSINLYIWHTLCWKLAERGYKDEFFLSPFKLLQIFIL